LSRTIYVIDGSLEGLLSAVFEWFERKPGTIILQVDKYYQPDAFLNVTHVHNDSKKADRVWNGLKAKLSKGWMRRFYCTYLSETPSSLSELFDFACYVFLNREGAEANFGNRHVLAVSQTAVKVEREKHRMEAFIRFQHLADGTFYCGIDPDFNVLPLVSKHFIERYADQKWIIYDLKRQYGLYYDLKGVKKIYLDPEELKKVKTHSADLLAEPEALYTTLWKDYFKSTNIASRKNTKLHVKHVPKRYWKYLTEKQGI
jgi:probable DNA metabolism protein